MAVHRDDVSELGSTASRAMSEHDGSDSCHVHGGKRDHDHRQRQQNEDESVHSCGSLSTLHSECEGSRYTSATSIGGSTVTMMGISSASGHRREKQKQRRKRRDRARRNGPENNPSVSAVESVHFEAHLLHRVCEVTGKLPDGGDGGGSSNSDADSDDERSEMSLLEDSGEHQLARLRRSPEMMDILVRLKALSVSLFARNGRGADPGSSNQSGGVGNAMTGRRADVVRFAQQEYLQLFEEMLGELLKAQREKSKVR